MIDGMLTLTKRGAFWLAILFVVTVAMSAGVSAIVGYQEPIFLLFALAIAGIFVLAGTYTLGKKLIGLFRRGGDKTPTP
jgi:lipid-binding SYLF domain-containing protein